MFWHINGQVPHILLKRLQELCCKMEFLIVFNKMSQIDFLIECTISTNINRYCIQILKETYFSFCVCYAVESHYNKVSGSSEIISP